MLLDENELDENIMFSQDLEDSIGKTIPGVIKSVQSNSIHPLYVEFSQEKTGFVSAF